MFQSDRVLWEKWRRNRDADAVAEIVSRHAGMVFSTMIRYGKDSWPQVFVINSDGVIREVRAGWRFGE